jgi:hypothetical protein
VTVKRPLATQSPNGPDDDMRSADHSFEATTDALSTAYSESFEPYRAEVHHADRWDEEYANGRWDHLENLAELSRFSIVVGYCAFFEASRFYPRNRLRPWHSDAPPSKCRISALLWGGSLEEGYRVGAFEPASLTQGIHPANDSGRPIKRCPSSQ